MAVSVPFLVFTSASVWRLHQRQREQQEHALIARARDLARYADRDFSMLQSGIEGLAASNAVEQGDLAGFTRIMARLSARLGRVPIALVTSDGRLLAQTPVEPEASQLDEAAIRALTVDAFAGGGLAGMAPSSFRVTDLLTTGARGASALAAAAAAPGGADIVVAFLDASHSAGLIASGPPDAEPQVPDSEGSAVLDRNGVIVARRRDPERFIGRQMDEEFRRAVRSEPEGLLRNRRTLDGTLAVVAFSTAPESGYVAAVSVSETALEAPGRRDLAETLLMGCSLLAIGVAAAAWLAGRLVAALHRAGSGDLATPSGLWEVDELTHRLRAASQAREAAEVILRESEAKLRDLVGTLDLAAIMAREMDGTIRFWSHGCQQLYGWDAEEAIGRVSHDLLHTRFPVPLARIEQALLTEGTWTGDLTHTRRDGTRIIAAAHKALKRDAAGQAAMVMESLVDVTALRQAQEELRAINRTLEQRVDAEVAAREAAQTRAAHADRVQALGQLAGGIAHDFNNVLQAVAGGAALISRRPDDGEAVRRLVHVVSDAAARGASITRRMLLLARRSDLKAEPVEVTALLAGMREVFVYTLGASIEVRVSIDPGVQAVLADRAQLETALVNLATNARDAMPSGGVIQLSAGQEAVRAGVAMHAAGLQPGRYVRLTVSDTGGGMDRATLARVGEPFFTTKDIGKGTGLGLSMVRAFADESGGGFTIDSAAGLGTKATIWLPATEAEAAGADDEPMLSRITGLILLVDDDRLVRDTLTEQLEELGHKVLAASGGTDALAILHARKAVDLMITDLSMPGMNGLALIKQVHDFLPGLPAILLTGYAGDAAGLAIDGATSGAYSLIRKPASTAQLNARVVELLTRG